jgi:hypothetical protein
MIDLNKPLDGVDYRVISLKHPNEEDFWQVVLLKGEHQDKKLVFTNIEYDGKNNTLKFLLDVVDEDGVLEKATPELEDLAFKILQDIIKSGLVDGSVVFDDQDSSN